MLLRWCFFVHPDVRVQRPRVLKKIDETLKSTQGWTQKGYMFQNVDDVHHCDFVICMVPNDYIVKKCRLHKMSCADTDKNIVYINEARWKRGSSASRLSLDDYRTYIVMHEVGHIIGRGHHTCTKGRAPVMMQQTLGIGDCRPNCWPLHWE